MKFMSSVIAVSVSGMHKLSGICTMKVSSVSVSSGSPILPSPIFKSHAEKF
nr:hypothetical protein [Tanacetum cinerariifolium]